MSTGSGLVRLLRISPNPSLLIWRKTMVPSSFQRLVVLFVAVSFALLPIARTAQAGIIATETAIEISDRSQQVDRVNELLARQSVQDVMVKLGVDPADASARVESLTAEELELLENNLAELPAGGVGVIEVVGIVAVVLIVLELLGVTNVFVKF